MTFKNNEKATTSEDGGKRISWSNMDLKQL